MADAAPIPNRTAGRSYRLRPKLAVALFIALTACSSDNPATDSSAAYTPTPQKPWSSDHYSSTRLILKRTGDGFGMVSSTPSFGGVTETEVSTAIPDILGGKQRLYEYIARDGTGDLLARGYFTVPLTIRATFAEADDPERVHHAEVENPNPLVRLAIPFTPDVATVEFDSMVPDDDTPYEQWKRRSAGSVRIESAASPQQQKEDRS